MGFLQCFTDAFCCACSGSVFTTYYSPCLPTQSEAWNHRATGRVWNLTLCAVLHVPFNNVVQKIVRCGKRKAVLIAWCGYRRFFPLCFFRACTKCDTLCHVKGHCQQLILCPLSPPLLQSCGCCLTLPSPSSLVAFPHHFLSGFAWQMNPDFSEGSCLSFPTLLWMDLSLEESCCHQLLAGHLGCSVWQSGRMHCQCNLLNYLLELSVIK